MSFERLAFSRFKYLIVVCALAFSAFCAVKASGQCQYDLNGVGYNSGPGDPAACPYRGPANRGTSTAPAAGTDGYSQLGTAIGNALGQLITQGLTNLLSHRQKAQQDMNAANARVAAAVAAENEARARNDRAAADRANAAADAARIEAAAAKEREREATAAYISERNKLTGRMMGVPTDAPRQLMGVPADTPRALMGVPADAPRKLMGDGGASQSHAGDELAGMAIGLPVGTVDEQADLKSLPGFGGGNAACIADGRPECLAPVVRLQVRPDHPPIPEDTAEFEKSLPPGALTNPKIKPLVDQLDRQANQRADNHDWAAKDKQDAIAHPNDPAPARDSAVYAGKMTGAKKDEDGTEDIIKHTVVNFAGPGQIEMGGTSGGANPKGAGNSGSGGTSPP